MKLLKQLLLPRSKARAVYLEIRQQHKHSCWSETGSKAWHMHRSVGQGAAYWAVPLLKVMAMVPLTLFSTWSGCASESGLARSATAPVLGTA